MCKVADALLFEQAGCTLRLAGGLVVQLADASKQQLRSWLLQRCDPAESRSINRKQVAALQLSIHDRCGSHYRQFTLSKHLAELRCILHGIAGMPDGMLWFP